ncbi:FkbM family methyltransferase [Candidatus Methylomirabilis sp.]|uniref:FkbM family methyltransferase n=1 Tax=Candidatus Methylomirabilis sp. TaxID=2032687 RepID=UPI002A626D38|nr:FkbM family methyltransferase [Candidatus Methylomirabilis sp.]
MGAYSFSYAMFRIVQNVGLIFRNEPSRSRLPMLLTYCRLVFKYRLGIALLKLPIRQEIIFGFTVKFFDYSVFLFLFEEIFICKQYDFKATSYRPVILDCGSNIGMSLLYFKRVYPDCVLVAFEADRKTFELLKENVQGNKLRDVILVNRAVLDRTGPVEFYSDPGLPGSLAMSANPERGLKARTMIEAITLSEYLHSEIDFLKMDIEGAEGRVLRELADRNKLKLVKEMVFEYHHHERPAEDALSGVLAILEQNGFGYEICDMIPPPFQRGRFRGMLIYAYQK